MTLHCAVGRECSKDTPVQLHPEVSSALSDGEQLLHTCMQAWQAVGQHCRTTLLVDITAAECASFQDMWHFWVLQSIKWWKGKLPRATPSLKCFPAASAMPDLWMMSTSHGAVFCAHDTSPKRRLHSPSSLTMPLHNSVPLHDVLVLMHKEVHIWTQVPDSWKEDGAKDGAAPWNLLWRFKFQGQSGPKGSRRWILTLWTLF